ncbi:MAG: preprotein translocase subunit YajC [Microbacterium sp.]|nr:MAG: preprotein translocase subunit YajC [Microbacterium sp.]
MPQEYLLLVALAVLLVFMFWSSRRRAKRMKEEQEAKVQQMVPGVKVLLQGGLYGRIVAYDAEDLSKSARVELAPGVEVEVHSQGILRIVDEQTETVTEDEFLEAETDQAEYAADVASGLASSISADDARERADEAPGSDADPRDKPQA